MKLTAKIRSVQQPRHWISKKDGSSGTTYPIEFSREYHNEKGETKYEYIIADYNGSMDGAALEAHRQAGTLFDVVLKFSTHDFTRSDGKTVLFQDIWVSDIAVKV